MSISQTQRSRKLLVSEKSTNCLGPTSGSCDLTALNCRGWWDRRRFAKSLHIAIQFPRNRPKPTTPGISCDPRNYKAPDPRTFKLPSARSSSFDRCRRSSPASAVGQGFRVNSIRACTLRHHNKKSGTSHPGLASSHIAVDQMILLTFGVFFETRNLSDREVRLRETVVDFFDQLQTAGPLYPHFPLGLDAAGNVIDPALARRPEWDRVDQYQWAVFAAMTERYGSSNLPPSSICCPRMVPRLYTAALLPCSMVSGRMGARDLQLSHWSPRSHLLMAPLFISWPFVSEREPPP